MTLDKPKVIVIGAGFGGLWATKTLRRSPVEVILIDRNNYHTFFPLLYQVGTAELAPDNIAKPVRSMLQKIRNVSGVDLESKSVSIGGQVLQYSYLIVPTGSVTNYFGVPGAEKHAFPLRTLEQGVELRNHILFRFEEAPSAGTPEERSPLLTFTVVGGGPTGVEFCGALSELIRGPLRRDMPTLNVREASVILLEAGSSLLSGLPTRLRDYAFKRLAKLGVDVRLDSEVSRITPDEVRLTSGEVINTKTVIWTAGVRGDEIARSWGLPLGRNGRVPVLPTLQVKGRSEVYVVGDLSYIEGAERQPPMVAPVALEQGKTAANNIRRQLAGELPQAFRYKDRGTMAVIGRNAAVAHLFNRWEFLGLIGWMIWLALHLYQLIGFRNKLSVLINWAWDYVFLDRVVRLILPVPREKP